MGIQKNIPNIKPGDWTSVRQVISRLASRIGPASTPTFSGLILTDSTASRLIATDVNKQLVSNDLIDWISGISDEIDVTDDGDGTVTIGLVNPLIVAKGGTGVNTLTNHGILLGSGTNAITPLGIAANGQIPIGKAIPEGWLGISSGEYDSHCGDSYDHNLTEALDGTDYWAHSGNEVHWFILDLGTTYYITKVRGRSNGGSFDPVDIDIFISDDKENWGDAVYEGIDTWQDVADWVEIEVTPKEGRYIKIQINATEGGSPGAIQFGQGGGSPITIFDAYSASTSSDPVLATITGTANQITVTNGAGSITLSTPQDIDTQADVQFNDVTVGSDLYIASQIVASVLDIAFKLTDASGASAVSIRDSGNNEVAAITSDGEYWSQTFSGEVNGVVYVNSQGFLQADDELLAIKGGVGVGINKAVPTVALDVVGAITASGIITGEQITSTDDITMAGLFTNTPAADDATIFTIDGATNDRAYSGAEEIAARILRDISGSGSVRNNYSLFLNSLYYNYDYSGVTSTEKNIYTMYNFLAYTGDIAFTGGILNAVHYIKGLSNLVSLTSDCQIANSTAKTVDISLFGSNNEATLDADYNITGAGVVTTNIIGGRFKSSVGTPSITAGTPVINYIGGEFIATGNATGTSTAYGGKFSASGADTNYGIYITVGQSYFGDDIAIADGKDIILDTTTGTKIGTATNQKLGFFNATPVVQQAYTAVSDPPTQAEVTVIRDALVNLGLMAAA